MSKHILFRLLSLIFILSCSSEPESQPDSTLTTTIKNIILTLTTIAENSQTKFNYSYAENIGDGRGITFGIIGFTSGTYDGTILLKHILELDPNNILCSYIPAFETIDKLPHDEEGKTDDTTGLGNFIDDFHIHGNDPKVNQAQLDLLDSLYWNPAFNNAKETGAKLNITYGELYDACVNHGFDGTGSNAKGLKQLVEETINIVEGTPKSGIDEKAWLAAFLDVRLNYMNSDSTWKNAVDRVEMFRRILNTGNVNLSPPFNVTCYGDSYIVDGTQP